MCKYVEITRKKTCKYSALLVTVWRINPFGDMKEKPPKKFEQLWTKAVIAEWTLQIKSYCLFFHPVWTCNFIPLPLFLLCEEKCTTWSENHRNIIHPKSPTAPYKLSLFCLAGRSACQLLAPKNFHKGRQRVSYGQQVKGVNYLDVGLHRRTSCAARQCHCKVFIWQWYHTLGVRLRAVASTKNTKRTTGTLTESLGNNSFYSQSSADWPKRFVLFNCVSEKWNYWLPKV